MLSTLDALVRHRCAIRVAGDIEQAEANTAIAGERNSRRLGIGELVIKKGTVNLDGRRFRSMPRAAIPYALGHTSRYTRRFEGGLACQRRYVGSRRWLIGQACVILGVAAQTLLVYSLVLLRNARSRPWPARWPLSSMPAPPSPKSWSPSVVTMSPATR